MADITVAPLSKAAKPLMGSRLEAKLAGAVRYIDGRPCNRGHNPTIRLTSNTQCMACRDMMVIEAKTRLPRPHGFTEGMNWRGKPIYTGTRPQAEKAGAVYYISTERPCKNGHYPAIRLTSNHYCVLCSAEYHNEHKDEINAKKRAFHADNTDIFSIRMKARYAANPGYFKLRASVWAANNRERRRQTHSVWHAENAEYTAEYYDYWRKNNPEKVAAKIHRRRARKLGSTEHFTADDICRIFVAQGQACAYCWIPLTPKTRAIDHFIALARGGSNGPDNTICACRPCNARKNSRDPGDFIQVERNRLLLLRKGHGAPNRTDPCLPILLIIDDLLS